MFHWITTGRGIRKIPESPPLRPYYPGHCLLYQLPLPWSVGLLAQAWARLLQAPCRPRPRKGRGLSSKLRVCAFPELSLTNTKAFQIQSNVPPSPGPQPHQVNTPTSVLSPRLTSVILPRTMTGSRKVEAEGTTRTYHSQAEPEHLSDIPDYTEYACGKYKGTGWVIPHNTHKVLSSLTPSSQAEGDPSHHWAALPAYT